MKATVAIGVAIMLAMCAGMAQAKGPEAMKDLPAALEAAKAQGKLLFIQYGREACGNCQTLKGYIKGGQLRLPEDKYVYVDLDCDDANTSQAFRSRFKVEGQTLPFVVVADSDGQQLAGRAGYGQPRDYDKMLKDARKGLSKTAAPAGKMTSSSGARALADAADVPQDPAREVREWKMRMGPPVKAALYETSKGHVSLRKEDGAVVKYFLNNFSPADQDYIKAAGKPAPASDTSAGE